jgi:Tol biopolymer transport system component
VRAAGSHETRLESPQPAAQASDSGIEEAQTAEFANGDLQIMTIADDRARAYNVRPSPDAGHVAFDSDRDGERGVFVANRDGTDVRRVSPEGYAADPTWSPDGRTLAFLRVERDRPGVRNLWLVDVSSGNSRRVTAFTSGETGRAAWFPDGRRICYAHNDQLVIQNTETGDVRRYGSPVGQRRLDTPAVSRDGEHVMFHVNGSGAWLLNLPDGSMTFALTDPTVGQFSWSEDGRRVAFYSRRNNEWGIWVMAPRQR